MNSLPSIPVGLRRYNKKALVLLCLHAVIFTVVYWFAFFIRNDFSVDATWPSVYLATVGGVVAVKLAIFYWLGHCHVSWRRIAFSDLTSLIWAATLAMLVVTSIEGLILSTGRLGMFPRVPRSVIVLDWAGTVLAIGGIRALWRSVREELRPIFTSKPIRTALIVGADEAGELLARNLMSAANSQYFVVGFLDDDPGLLHNRVAGLEVLGGIDSASHEVGRRRVDEVMVQSGSLTGKRFRKLLEDCTQAGAQVKVMPAIDELLVGHDNPSHVKPRSVEIKDLLRREPVKLDNAAVRHLIEGNTVLVTGAGRCSGSIPKNCCWSSVQRTPCSCWNRSSADMTSGRRSSRSSPISLTKPGWIRS
jgi:FlaA1/EpsC-like NDP-sugar epimerase